ncbi:MAG: PilN domain-containing protein [Patescibacteria group bacterium]|nr:PilN domain-containing protein [Patescibacteria group bacterium]
MASKNKINLLPKGQFEYSTLGKFIQWAVNVGRWIVVLTEFIVISAFCSRFYFDTVLADLFDKTKQKQAIVASAASFEENFRQVQDKIKVIKSIMAQENKPAEVVTEVSRLIPQSLSLTEIFINQKSLSLKGVTLSEKALRIFVTNLSNSSLFKEVNLDSISTAKDKLQGIDFNISIVLN